MLKTKIIKNPTCVIRSALSNNLIIVTRSISAYSRTRNGSYMKFAVVDFRQYIDLGLRICLRKIR